MPGPSARAPSPDPDERRIDVEPSGFGGFYGAALATVLLSAAMASRRGSHAARLARAIRSGPR